MPGFFANLTLDMARAAGHAHVSSRKELNPREVVEMMEAYYYNNDLYLALMQLMREEGLWHEAMKPLRNPTFAAVEFYVLTLWPGSLPGALSIVAKNSKIQEPIEKIWKWSNWAAKKQLAARQYAMTGDMFIRVRTNGDENTDPDKVRIQTINSKYVTDFDLDDEGHVIWLRYDVARWKRDDKGTRVNYTYTEVWDPKTQKIWRHDKSPGADLETLGDPDETIDLMKVVGIDFVPWVHAPFRDMGEFRGLPVIWTVLSKIDELNRKVTRQSQMMYRHNKPYWMAMSGMVDDDNRPGPAPELETTDLKDDVVFNLPGFNRIESLVPNLAWDAFEKAAGADMEEIKRDLPELRYYDMMMSGNESGRALQVKLTPAISLVNEARGGAETALSRAHKMALSIGQHLELEGFTKIGTFDKGDLEHTFAERDVIPITEDDRAGTAKTYVELGVDRNSALKRAGWTDAELKDLPPLVGPGGPQASPEEQDVVFEAAIERATRELGPVVDATLQGMSDRFLDQLLTNGGIERIAAATAEAGGNGAGQGGAA